MTGLGFTCHWPKYESVEAVRGQIIKRQCPLFPGYLFFGLVDLWRSVFDSEHVTGVLMSSEDSPSRLPQEVIDELYTARVDNGGELFQLVGVR